MSRAPKQDVRKEFAARLVAARKDVGWSQEDLSNSSELARSYMSGVERGTRNISLDNICRLAHALGIRPGQLLDFDVEEAPARRAQAQS